MLAPECAAAVSAPLHLIGEEPTKCLAHGASYVREGVQDVVFCYLRFPSGVVAHLHLSWLDPHKERRITVVGAQKMATFDDMLIEGKLTIYDKGFDEDTRSWGEYIARSGDTFSPRISNIVPQLPPKESDPSKHFGAGYQYKAQGQRRERRMGSEQRAGQALRNLLSIAPRCCRSSPWTSN